MTFVLNNHRPCACDQIIIMYTFPFAPIYVHSFPAKPVQDVFSSRPSFPASQNWDSKHSQVVYKVSNSFLPSRQHLRAHTVWCRGFVNGPYVNIWTKKLRCLEGRFVKVTFILDNSIRALPASGTVCQRCSCITLPLLWFAQMIPFIKWSYTR